MNFHYSWPTVTGLFAPEEARRSIAVAHSGNGGDEIFGGYPKYAMLARRAAVDRGLTRPLTQLVAAGAGGMLPASSALRGRLGRYRLGYDELVLSTLVTGSDPHELRTVARGQLAKAALVEPSFVTAVRREHAAGRDRTAVLHSLAFLGHWLERWVDG